MTHELNPQQIINQPPSVMVDKPLQLPQLEKLRSGQSFIMDSSASALPLSEIGLDSDKLKNVAVVGRVGNDTNKTEHEQNGINFALVRVREESGIDTFFVVSDRTNEDGTVSKSWISLPRYTPLTIGRDDPSNKDDLKFIGGKKLSGKDFSGGISRKHMTVELTEEGIKISDSSLNGTQVEAIQATPDHKVSGSGAVQATGVVVEKVPESGKAGLIDSVPRTSDQAAELLAQDRERKLNPYREQMNALDDKIDEIKASFSIDDQIIMFRYVNAWRSKGDAQVAGDGEASYAQEKIASDALNSLTPEARAVAKQILQLEQAKDKVRSNSKMQFKY